MAPSPALSLSSEPSQTERAVNVVRAQELVSSTNVPEAAVTLTAPTLSLSKCTKV